MKLVKFSQGNNEVLVDPKKVLFIKKEIMSQQEDWQPPIVVYVIFSMANEWLEFFGKDAKNVWDYFVDYYTGD